jgi:hypothetical protein
MASGPKRVLSLEDLERAARAIAEEIETDEIVVIGSQALLVGDHMVLRALRMSREFDLYPSPTSNPDNPEFTEDASHSINANFGEGSAFNQTHGFFIDGVSSATATLPPDWRDRAVSRDVQCHDGQTVRLVAPAIADIVASKLARGEPKDLMFASLCLGSSIARYGAIKSSIEATNDGFNRVRVLELLDRAAKGQKAARAEARAQTGTVPKGAERSPLDDINAVDMLRRIIGERES